MNGGMEYIQNKNNIIMKKINSKAEKTIKRKLDTADGMYDDNTDRIWLWWGISFIVFLGVLGTLYLLTR